MSLGLVYAPCAGPILAGVITVSASQDFTAGRLAVALAYSAGSGVVLYGLMLGGRRLTSPLAQRSGSFQRAMGALMVVVAVLMAAELDIRFENEIASSLPALVVNPSKELEETGATRDRLADLRGGRRGTVAEAAGAGDDAGLPVLGRAPEIQGTQRWFNTPNGSPLSLARCGGGWCCSTSGPTPASTAFGRFRSSGRGTAATGAPGLTIIGVHAPEFPFERDAGNVERAIARNELRYPVAQDNDFATWRAYGNQYWPAKYLIDARGRVRYAHFGEGEYEATERAIRALLSEAGRERLGRRASARVETAVPGATPESYLGAERAARFLNGPIAEGRRDFELPGGAVAALPRDHLAYEGPWRIDASHGTAAGRGARLHLRFSARRVFLVLGARGTGRDRRGRRWTAGAAASSRSPRPVSTTS